MSLTYEPIGVIRSPFTDLSGMPIQPSQAIGVPGRIELVSELQGGLKDLEGFSHLILLYHFHKSTGYRLEVVPFLDTVARGVFSTRAPKRPNPIGLSIVRLITIEEATLLIEDVDVLDGTPLLDIKPYVPAFDHRPDARSGWLEKTAQHNVRSDDRFI
jgi:tRNA-Thr(GGU) m(6)t(6)A37 methyltransferase TsaA